MLKVVWYIVNILYFLLVLYKLIFGFPYISWFVIFLPLWGLPSFMLSVGIIYLIVERILFWYEDRKLLKDNIKSPFDDPFKGIKI